MKQDFKTLDEQGAAAVVYPSSQREKDIGNFEEQYYTAHGVKKGDASMEVRKRFADFQTQMRAMLTQYANDKGVAPPPQEQQSMFDTLLTPVLIEGVNREFGRETPQRAFEIQRLRRGDAGVEAQLESDDVPAEDYNRLKENMSAGGTIDVTDDDIVEQYENELLMSIGVEPTIEFGEIPEGIRRQLVTEFPNHSREQLREAYLGYLVEALKEDAGTQ
jgi:hypothetical protein